MPTTWTPAEALLHLSVDNLSASAPVSPAEEKRLLGLVARGRRAARQLKDNHLAETARTELEAHVHAGHQARRTLIQVNGRLVISIAKRYTGHGLSLSELCQEGVLGLIRAIDKFDISRGTRLSTYASYWIRQNVSRAVAIQPRMIRLPIHQVERLGRIRKATARLTQQLGRMPDLAEIAAQTGDTPEQIEQLLQRGQNTLSLEEPVSEDGATLADFIENDFVPGLGDQVDARLLEEEIQRVLASLTARESRIVELRYGLRDGCPMTLEDVAKRFGLTRERIRQIEQEALGKLRRPEPAGRLRSFAV
jgi:RNA polymerase primary sigma factor